jgi:hypothetical protein
MRILLNIKNIIDNGELYERAFFNWLNVEKIQWFIAGTDLNYIGLFNEESVTTIKEYWHELKN